MPEPKGNDVRTLAVRVSPDYHAQLSMVAQVDEISLTDLMMTALENHMTARREAPDFKAKVQKALEDAEAQMARTRAMLLGTLPEAAPADEADAGEEPRAGLGARMRRPAEVGFPNASRRYSFGSLPRSDSSGRGNTDFENINTRMHASLV